MRYGDSGVKILIIFQPLLTVVKELDREEYGVPDSALHVVVVGAKDMGAPPRTGTATVRIFKNIFYPSICIIKLYYETITSIFVSGNCIFLEFKST